MLNSDNLGSIIKISPCNSFKTSRTRTYLFFLIPQTIVLLGPACAKLELKNLLNRPNQVAVGFKWANLIFLWNFASFNAKLREARMYFCLSKFFLLHILFWLFSFSDNVFEGTSGCQLPPLQVQLILKPHIWYKLISPQRNKMKFETVENNNAEKRASSLSLGNKLAQWLW